MAIDELGNQAVLSHRSAFEGDRKTMTDRLAFMSLAYKAFLPSTFGTHYQRVRNTHAHTHAGHATRK